MISKDEIQELLHSTETYRVERTVSTGDTDKFQEAICAFANDMPNSRKNGYLILGAHDDGRLSGLRVSDDQKLSFHTTTTNVVDNVVKDVVNGVVKIDISQLTDRQINILEFMVQYPTITAKEKSQRLSLASRTIQRDIAILTNLGRVVREGGRYDGTWRVITKPKELTHEI
jgi:predicted HTH transcriptional regulator